MSVFSMIPTFLNFFQKNVARIKILSIFAVLNQ